MASNNLLKQQQLAEATEDVVTLKLKDNTSDPESPDDHDDDDLSPKALASKQTLLKSHGRTSSIYFSSRMPCWFSMQINLTDICLQEELFTINSHLSVFFKDNKHNDFHGLFDDKCSALMEQNGNVTFDNLNIEVRKKIPFKGSFILNSSDIQIKRCHLELYDKENNVWQLYINFNAACAENLELLDFPFDSQFLNIQMVYSTLDYRFLSECPDWILNDPEQKYKLFDSDKAIKLTVKDTIATQYKVETPWIDFRSKNNFGLIRLRVQRQPTFYLFNGIFPLFLVICCSFASFVMPVEEYLGDKLSYIITLLLTTAAYQYALSSELPKTPEATMIDNYILYAYAVLAGLVLEISIVSLVHEAGYDDAVKIIDYATAGLASLVWLTQSGRFVYKYYIFKARDVDWDKLSEVDETSWSGEDESGSKFIYVDKGRHKGTDDQ